MKTLAVGAFAATLLLAGAAAAQEETVAAGRIQNTFDASGRQTAVATQQRTEADPRAEPAIRAFIGGLQTGTVDWNAFTPNLAAQLQPGEAQAVEIIRGLGALESVEFFQHRDGADLFLVRFEQADTQWVVGFDEAGKIAALLFRPAPPIEQTPEAAPGE
ncbi:hypothetical protein [Brevundimonas fluminis]|jgi:hypothetical protein|uniref:hypothetical protein n=1 Tax=Brevundimonas fluminis TaxID=2487274 RepID=UPI000F658D5C|nr:hypothetical protein [Brevundimonas fluminis]